MSYPEHVKVAIIGGGPAGLTAGIYAGRAALSPAVFCGIATASQMFSTTDVENFPSHLAILGPDLVNKMQEQAESCGSTLIFDDVKSVDLTKRPFTITYGYEDSKMLADSLIVATGAMARRLDPPGEKEYWQKGVSACAVCDSMMAKGRDCVVVGGGDVACEEATYLSKLSTKIYLVLRRDQFRASNAMVKRVKSDPKIEILYDSAVHEIKGDGKRVSEVVIKNLKTGDQRSLAVNALYWAVGHIPQTNFLDKNQIEMDGQGYIVLKNHPTTDTSVPGVFAAGDCADHIYRQAVVAAGAGSKAALDAERFLAINE